MKIFLKNEIEVIFASRSIIFQNLCSGCMVFGIIFIPYIYIIWGKRLNLMPFENNYGGGG